jgi:hypothetical protein
MYLEKPKLPTRLQIETHGAFVTLELVASEWNWILARQVPILMILKSYNLVGLKMKNKKLRNQM